MTAIFVQPRQQIIDANGDPINGAYAKFFEAGTTTPLTVYQDSALTTPHATSVTADPDGRLPVIYLTNVSYKAVLYDADDVVIDTADDLSPPFSLDPSGGLIMNGSDLQGAKAGYITASGGDSGVTTPSADADDLLVENSGNAGITIATPNTDKGTVAFADPENATAALMEFDHLTNTWALAVQTQEIITATDSLLTLKKAVQADGTLGVTGASTFTGVTTHNGGIKADNVTSLGASDLNLNVPTGQSAFVNVNGTPVAEFDSTGHVQFQAAAANDPGATEIKGAELELISKTVWSSGDFDVPIPDSSDYTKYIIELDDIQIDGSGTSGAHIEIIALDGTTELGAGRVISDTTGVSSITCQWQISVELFNNGGAGSRMFGFNYRSIKNPATGVNTITSADFIDTLVRDWDGVRIEPTDSANLTAATAYLYGVRRTAKD